MRRAHTVTAKHILCSVGQTAILRPCTLPHHHNEALAFFAGGNDAVGPSHALRFSYSLPSCREHARRYDVNFLPENFSLLSGTRGGERIPDNKDQVRFALCNGACVHEPCCVVNRQKACCLIAVDVNRLVCSGFYLRHHSL